MINISVIHCCELLKQADPPLLIDVREEEEHEQFNIGGWHIPLGEIMKQSSHIPHTGKIVVYCKRGIRSAIAIQRLEEKFGYKNLVNLQGGMEEWKRNKLH